MICNKPPVSNTHHVNVYLEISCSLLEGLRDQALPSHVVGELPELGGSGEELELANPCLVGY